MFQHTMPHTKWPQKPSKFPVKVLPSLPTPMPTVSELREVLERACTPQPWVRAQGSSREGLYTVAPGQSPGKL